MDRSTFEVLFFDEAHNIEMCKRLNLRRTLRELTRDGATLSRRVDIEIRRRVPGRISRFIGPHALRYCETMTYVFHRSAGAASWRITPELFSDQIDCAGSLDFLPHPEGIVRRVTGEVSVRIPIVGKYMERFAVREIINSFNEAAALTDMWLAEHPEAYPREPQREHVPT